MLSALLKGGRRRVSGTLHFEQAGDVCQSVTGSVEGLAPAQARLSRAHEFGDNTNGCVSAGAHFNPCKRTHGAPDDEERQRRGFWGNVEADASAACWRRNHRQADQPDRPQLHHRPLVCHTYTPILTILAATVATSLSKTTGNCWRLDLQKTMIPSLTF
uniref:Sod_Cu domain-containing protein n=1 Tax=Macrostomum lignano TaxID=282301 RepID=A0A1I8FR23_9PLAT